MSLCNVRGLFATDTKQPEGAAVAALRDIDAVSHKKRRAACRRINQRFLMFLQQNYRWRTLLTLALFSSECQPALL